ncbi:hypothetical protein ACLMAL_28765 [Nocardia sp. CWNU-33]|uniref:hypothetical protein n=1 Tax=Nocardia sp. CWNU-33 TaxID=3392117 RepID=UPI00398F6765
MDRPACWSWARLWPFGQAWIRLELIENGANSTMVRMLEKIEKGSGRPLPSALQATVLRPRNQESLARLTDLVVTGYRETLTGR